MGIERERRRDRERLPGENARAERVAAILSHDTPEPDGELIVAVPGMRPLARDGLPMFDAADRQRPLCGANSGGTTTRRVALVHKRDGGFCMAAYRASHHALGSEEPEHEAVD
jgi:hypothetical protein